MLRDSNKRSVLLGSLILLGSSITGPNNATAQPGDSAGSSEPVARTTYFELWSTPRAGLFHFLIDWAAAEANEWPPYAPPLRERETWRTVVNDDEAGIWADAVATFDRTRNRSLLFDEGMLALRDWAAGVGTRQAIPADDRELADALEAALAVYEKHWWPAHDRRNREWIAAVAPELRLIEEEAVTRLEAAYGGSWPDEIVPADVVFYANPVGAYSTAGRLTISSGDRDNRMPQGAELVFHEASHTGPLEGPLENAVDAAFRSAGGEAPNRFWHDVIFFTAGEITRIAFEEAGRPGYRHYGETAGVYSRGERWTVELPAFERHWRPFLRSGSNDEAARRAALEAVAREVLSGSR